MIGPLVLLAVSAAALSAQPVMAACTCPEAPARSAPAARSTTDRDAAIGDGYRLIERQARGGNVRAMRIAGLWLAQGIGTPLDYQMAYYWLWQAKRRGDAIAANVIGEVERRLSPQERRSARSRPGEPF